MRLAAAIFLLSAVWASGATYYVYTTGSETFPYDSEATAARSLAVIRTNAYGAGDICYVGPGSYARWSASPTTNDCTWIGVNGPSETFLNGGGAYPLYGCGRFIGFTVTNAGDSAFYIITGLVGGSYISNFVFRNVKGSYGAICTYDATAVLNVYNTTVANCTNAGTGGGIYVYGGSTLNLTDCVITGCVSGGNGGGIYVTAGGYSKIQRTTLENCTNTSDGAAIWAGTFGRVVVSNSIIRHCKAGRYAAEYNILGFNVEIYGNESYATDVGMPGAMGGTLHNSTVAGNYTPCTNAGSAAMWHVEYFNSIVWNNWPYDADTYSASNSCHQKITGSLGTTGCITNYPQFSGIDLSGSASPTNTGLNFAVDDPADLALGAGSPCINAGTNLSWDASAVDLAGDTRRYGDNVDMGAYEYSPAAPPAGGQQRWRGIILE